MNKDAKGIMVEVFRSNGDNEQRRRLMAYLDRITTARRIKEADMERMSVLIERMRGPSRSYNQYAKDMDVAPSSVTRVAKKESQKVSSEFLAKMYECRDPDCGVTFDELLEANGLMEDRRRQAMMEARQFERDAQDIIRNDLYRSNIMAAKGDAEESSGFSTHRPDFVLNVKGNDGEEKLWAFDVRYCSEERMSDNGKMLLNSYNRASFFLDEYIGRIMAKFYMGTSINKWSIVLNRKEVYERFIERVAKRSAQRDLPDEISIILVDPDKRYVVSEWTLPTTAKVEEWFPFEPENPPEADDKLDYAINMMDILNEPIDEADD